jgi:hypothetical protein
MAGKLAERTGSGELLANDKFPDMKALADYCHSFGLKLGIYSSPGGLSLGGYLGSYQQNYQDAKTWADGVSTTSSMTGAEYSKVAPNPNRDELKKPIC